MLARSPANTDSGVYHKPGTGWYGKTKQGKHTAEADAIKAGYKASRKKKRPISTFTELVLEITTRMKRFYSSLASCSAELFVAENHFTVAYQLIVQPQAVFISGCFAARARRAAKQAHAGRRLKNIRRKRAAIDIEFDAQIAGVGDPGDLVAFIDHHDLRNQSNEYGAFSHCPVWPHATPGPMLLILSMLSDDSILTAKNSSDQAPNCRKAASLEKLN
jgi:hypothetical protein